MPDNQPQRLPISSIQEMNAEHWRKQLINPVLTTDFGLVYHMNAIEVFKYLFKLNTPYRVDDYRFLIFRNCDLDVTANLMTHHVVHNTVGFMGTGGVIQISRFPQDADLTGFVLKEEFMRIIMGGRLPSAFNGKIRNFYIQVSDEEADTLDCIIKIGYDLTQQVDFSRDTVTALLAACIHYVASLYDKYGGGLPKVRTRAQEVFNRFIQLVNDHAAHHHSLDYYADRLFITQRYLGTLVHQASGITAKEWIDRAIITEAKMALKHTDITVLQLSDQLRFPNPSFFCKYFKRLTGMTPQQYRTG